MKETQADLQAFRLKCYRQMLLEDIQDDYAIQDYQADAQEAQRMVTYLFAELERPNLPIEARADLLLTIFVALQIGYRNPDLFTRAVDMTYDLLPQLAEVAESPEAPIPNSQFDNSCPSFVVRCPSFVVRCQLPLLVHLYQETQDEELLLSIDHLMSTMSEDAMSEEDHYLQEIFQLTATA